MLKKDTILLRGDRNLWFDFTTIVKKKRKKVWDELEPMLNKYIKKNKVN